MGGVVALKLAENDIFLKKYSHLRSCNHFSHSKFTNKIDTSVIPAIFDFSTKATIEK